MVLRLPCDTVYETYRFIPEAAKGKVFTGTVTVMET
jgi:hypothetical protein